MCRYFLLPKRTIPHGVSSIFHSRCQLSLECSTSGKQSHPISAGTSALLKKKTTPVGFEPTRGDPIGLAGRRLSRSAKVSLHVADTLRLVVGCTPIACWWGCTLAVWGYTPYHCIGHIWAMLHLCLGPESMAMHASPLYDQFPSLSVHATCLCIYHIWSFNRLLQYPYHTERDDTCGIRTHAGRPHRLSRPTP